MSRLPQSAFNIERRLTNLQAQITALQAAVSAGSGSSPVLAATYEASNAGPTPILVLKSNERHDGDEVATHVRAAGEDGLIGGDIVILQDGVYAITAIGSMWQAGLTGGTLNVTFSFVSATSFILDSEVQADEAGGELDLIVTTVYPLSVSDTISITLYANVEVTGAYASLRIVKIG